MTVVSIGTEMPLGSALIAEHLSGGVPPWFVAVRCADNVKEVVGSDGTRHVKPKESSFVLIAFPGEPPFSLHAEDHEGRAYSPIVVCE